MVAIIVILVIVAAGVVWFLVGPHPEQTATHEGEPESRATRAGRSYAGPADAGTEDTGVPMPGEPGPSTTPRRGQ